MCALRGPTACTCRLRTRSIEPPATPTTRTSTARSAVACDATVTYDNSGRPSRIAATLVEVPPTSTMTPSVIAADRSAPATDAAGPEYSVLAGASRKPDKLGRPAVAAHHHHGAVMPASRTPSLDKLRGADGDRQDRRVECGGHRPQLEAVEARQFGAGARRQPGVAGDLHDRLLVAIVVGRERLGDRHCADAFADQPSHLAPDVAGRQARR